MKQLHEYDTPECDELEKLMCLTGHHEMKLARSLEQRLAACRDALEEIATYLDSESYPRNGSMESRLGLLSEQALTLTAPK
jgi:hypothetical protein